MPLTLIDIDSPGYEMDSISVDNFSGGKLAAQHLAALGHKRIACIRGSIETRYNQGRLNGFREGLMEAGLEVIGVVVLAGEDVAGKEPDGLVVVDEFHGGS